MTDVKYNQPGREMISRVGVPFDVVFYVHWWEPGSRRKHGGQTQEFASHTGVDSDGGYIEFYSVDEALSFIRSEVDRKDDEKEYRQGLVWAVVADLRCTVKIVKPQRKNRRRHRG